MNTAPNNPPLLDRLAAEYVLGTLRGAARARLERWRASSPALEQRCVYWEERLLPLLRGTRPVQPPAQRRLSDALVIARHYQELASVYRLAGRAEDARATLQKREELLEPWRRALLTIPTQSSP